jgi:hypothetical protein
MVLNLFVSSLRQERIAMHHSLRIALLLCFSSVALCVAAEGTLNVRSTPEGVEVWLDDKYIGDAPIFEKKLKPGRYTLRLVDPLQHNSIVEEIFIQESQTTSVEKTLTTKFGALKIVTEPAGAKVFLLTPLGETPLNNDFIVPGKYRLLLDPPNTMFEPMTEDVMVPKGDAVTVTKSLPQKNLLDTKAAVRLVLGAGAIAGFIWGAYGHGEFTKSPSGDAAINRALGLTLGTLCVIGFEITAFF